MLKSIIKDNKLLNYVYSLGIDTEKITSFIQDYLVKDIEVKKILLISLEIEFIY
jgi:hypothetical protein